MTHRGGDRLLRRGTWCPLPLRWQCPGTLGTGLKGRSGGRVRVSKRAFSEGFALDRISLGLLIVSRVDFIAFVLFVEAVGVRECTAV